MDESPSVGLSPIHTRHSESEIAGLGLAADLRSEALDLNRVGHVAMYGMNHGLERDRLAVAVVGRGTLELLVS